MSPNCAHSAVPPPPPPVNAGAASPVQLQSSTVTCPTATIAPWLARGLAPAAVESPMKCRVFGGLASGQDFDGLKMVTWPQFRKPFNPSFLRASRHHHPGSVVSLTVHVPCSPISPSVCPSAAPAPPAPAQGPPGFHLCPALGRSSSLILSACLGPSI